MKPASKYDLSSLDEFFSEFVDPESLCNCLVDLLFNYADVIDNEHAEIFKDDAGTIYLLYNELKKIKLSKSY